MKPVIGILGGMGPRATVEFERMLLDRLPGTDQELPTIISLNDGSIPDRTAFLLGRGRSPVSRLQRNLRLLESMGASLICLPCNTACAPQILGRLQPRSRLINLPEEVVRYLVNRGFRQVCLLATEGTIRAGTYQDLCAQNGIICITPPFVVQQKVSRIIELTKTGNLRVARLLSRQVAMAIQGAEPTAVILGCTELPLVKDALVPVDCTPIDTLGILADACVQYTNMQGETYDTGRMYA